MIRNGAKSAEKGGETEKHAPEDITPVSKQGEGMRMGGCLTKDYPGDSVCKEKRR